jgi:hypothetical protein
VRCGERWRPPDLQASGPLKALAYVKLKMYAEADALIYKLGNLDDSLYARKTAQGACPTPTAARVCVRVGGMGWGGVG